MPRLSRRWVFRALGFSGAGLVLPSRADAQVQIPPRLPMTREILTAPRRYYVRSDALYTDAPGRLDSPAGACKTWQQAVNLAMGLDLNNQLVTIQHGSEAGTVTFTTGLEVGAFVGNGRLELVGKDTSGSTFFNIATGLPCISLRDARVLVTVSNMKLQATGGELGLIEPIQNSLVQIMSGVIFGSASTAHIWVHDKQAMFYSLSNAYTIAGGAAYHIYVNGGMAFHEQSAATLTGTPAFSGAFVAAVNAGALQSIGSTFSGAATGQRYFASTNGVINSFGGGATYFPGSVAGATTSGGQYA
jgi:hypothetical protein